MGAFQFVARYHPVIANQQGEAIQRLFFLDCFVPRNDGMRQIEMHPTIFNIFSFSGENTIFAQ